MNLFELFVKIGVDDQASGQLKKITASIGNGLKTAAKVGVGAITTVSAGIAGLTKLSIDQYKEYEQLVGGIDTLFKGASDKVQRYASNAYKTAGMSANDYMSTATSFAASLINSFKDTSTEVTEEMANGMIKSLDKQVDAFEEATEKQIKLIDKQYNESLKLIDEEEYQRLKAIDDEIAAINALTEAEQEAFEKEEQEQRKAELKKRISSAETWEEREQAEKDLADYIEELQYNEILEQREAEIEKLKAKKDAIKSEADTRREALKEQHDYELQTYKETRDKELDYLKEHLKQQEDAIIASIGTMSGDSSLSAEAYDKAAEYADMAIQDISDNVNRLGNDSEMIKNAYQGFAKGQFMLLDNLKLGYGGTKTEMERLLEDAERLTGIDYDIGNFADIVGAIHAIQDEMGITGATAEEAEKTISGSWGMLAGAVKNLLTGFADSEADVGVLLDNVIDSVFIFGKNLVPRIKTIMSKMFDLVREALPEFLSGLWENISKGITYIKDNMPIILADLPLLITGFFESSSDMLEIGFMIIQRITESIISSLPRILASATELISTLVKGLADNMPQLINSAVEMIVLIADALTRPETLIPLLDAALSVIVALADALYLIADNETLRTASYQIMLNLMDFLIEGIPLILSAAWDIIVALVSALAESFITNLETMPDLLDMFVKWLTDEERLGGIFDAGVDIVKKLMAGIVATLPMIKEEIEEFFNNLFNGEEKIGLSGDFSNLSGNSEIEFNKSGLAKVGSNTINAIESNSSMSNKTHPNSVNLVLPDGTKFAEYLLPDLEGVSRARGTPIIQPT